MCTKKQVGNVYNFEFDLNTLVLVSSTLMKLVIKQASVSSRI